MPTHLSRGDGATPSPRTPLHRGRRRLSLPRVVAAFACLLSASTVALAGPGAAAAAPRVAPDQTVLALLADHGIRSAPRADATFVGTVAGLRPLTGERTVLPVLDEVADRSGRRWVRVLLPGRTLGHEAPPRSGWVRGTHAQLSTTPWHLVVDIGDRRVLVYRSGRLVHTFRAVVGKRSTPTPTGRFFVEENVRLRAAEPGAPFALATNARSKVLQEFDGGPGQIAIHGVENLDDDALGTAASHGCVRVSGAAVTWLAHRIGPGVPISIS